MKKGEFILFTSDNQYVVEYLLNHLILSTSISEALTFQDHYSAMEFKERLFQECSIECSVNTYIN